ncbi:MAG: hypothetical protein Q9223_005986 [Gallowayella weberi]
MLTTEAGEAALQALRASSVGLGTDIGQNTYASSVGVMGTSIEALKLVMTSILSTKPWKDDPNVVKMPWDYEIEASTLARAHPGGSAKEGLELKFGILWTDGVVRPQPPVRRAMRLVHTILQDFGHKAGQPISRRQGYGRDQSPTPSVWLTGDVTGLGLEASFA